MTLDYILDYGLVNVTRGTESGGEYSFDQKGFDERYGNITAIFIASHPVKDPEGSTGQHPRYFSSLMIR